MSEYIEHDKNGVSVGLVEKKFFTFAEPPDELVLESGSKLGPITIAYETYGTLDADKSNVVLILHALSGDSHVAGDTLTMFSQIQVGHMGYEAHRV